MVNFLKKIKNNLFHPFIKKGSSQSGMTYIELIVVLTIFGIMSTVLLFKYGTFNAQIDLQNLSQDIALQIVSAQKSALSGKLPDIGGAGYDLVNPTSFPNWRPAYGVYFNSNPATVASTIANPDNKKIISFVDTNNVKYYQEGCNDLNRPGETSDQCIDVINIQKGDYVSNICTKQNISDADCVRHESVSITFTRPDSSAFIVTETNPDLADLSINQAAVVIITISSENDNTLIKQITIDASGRISVS
ncbi:MAG: type II secretion system protein [Candidatus Nomurabacteria bacterium]|nr:type II secretion system protein [Candidatus Nomurabacteria bacterium]